MRVVFEGTPEEFRRLFGPQLPIELVANELDLQEMVEGLSRVQETARRAISIICRSAPRVGYDEVAKEMGVTTKVLSGYMSSFGHSAPSVGALIRRNESRREYVIETEVANLILEALQLIDSPHGR